MTQVWDKSGKRLVVTKLIMPTTTIVKHQTQAANGYAAVQVAIGSTNAKPTKPLKAHLAKAKVTKKPKYIREIKLADEEPEGLGSTLTASQILTIGDQVNVSGTTKGRGFAGGVKRWGFRGGPRTHGQSDRERAPGSIGQGTTPGRVHKGKKMAGHYGVARQTIANLTVVYLNDQTGEIWLSGPVSGARNSLVELRPTGVKTKFEGLYYEVDNRSANNNESSQSESQDSLENNKTNQDNKEESVQANSTITD